MDSEGTQTPIGGREASVVKGIWFHFRQGWRTLHARPGLSVLAVLMLAFVLWLCAALLGTLLLLRSLQQTFLRDLAADIELQHDVTGAQTARIADLAEHWSGVADVSFVSPDSSLRVHSAEVGEDLQAIFGGNPFPPVLRVRFKGVSLSGVDSLAVEAARWEGVVGVVYPREIWQRLDELALKIKGRIGLVTLGLLLISLFMIALVMRAQFTGRSREWRLLRLLGMERGGLHLVAGVQAALLGLGAGIIAALGVGVLVSIYHFVFLETVNLPAWFYAATVIAGVVFTIPVGLISARGVKLYEE
jgi:cell division protein FtsX